MTNQVFKFSGYLEPEEVRGIINSVPLASHDVERDQLLLELLWQSGARVTEGITLTAECMGMTSVILANLKQKDHEATKEVEISGDLCQRLKDYCDRHNIGKGEYVFRGRKGSHVCRSYVWKLFNRASEQARVYRFGKKHPKVGIRLKGAYPHLFRHSSAMHLLEESGDIMIVKQQLGHADVRTTQGYAFVKARNVKKAVSKVKW